MCAKVMVVHDKVYASLRRLKRPATPKMCSFGRDGAHLGQKIESQEHYKRRST
jgi:hypothetical protein